MMIREEHDANGRKAAPSALDSAHHIGSGQKVKIFLQGLHIAGVLASLTIISILKSSLQLRVMWETAAFFFFLTFVTLY